MLTVAERPRNARGAEAESTASVSGRILRTAAPGAGDACDAFLHGACWRLLKSRRFDAVLELVETLGPAEAARILPSSAIVRSSIRQATPDLALRLIAALSDPEGSAPPADRKAFTSLLRRAASNGDVATAWAAHAHCAAAHAASGDPRLAPDALMCAALLDATAAAGPASPDDAGETSPTDTLRSEARRMAREFLPGSRAVLASAIAVEAAWDDPRAAEALLLSCWPESSAGAFEIAPLWEKDTALDAALAASLESAMAAAVRVRDAPACERLYNRLRAAGLAPSPSAFVSLAQAFARSGSLTRALAVVGQVRSVAGHFVDGPSRRTPSPNAGTGAGKSTLHRRGTRPNERSDLPGTRMEAKALDQALAQVWAALLVETGRDAAGCAGEGGAAGRVDRTWLRMRRCMAARGHPASSPVPPSLQEALVEAHARAGQGHAALDALDAMAAPTPRARGWAIAACGALHSDGRTTPADAQRALSILEEAIEAKQPVDGRWAAHVTLLAARAGDADVLRRARTRGCPWHDDACAAAAGGGHLHVLRRLHDSGCPWDERTCAAAARGGHLDVLKYAHENGCPWDERTSEHAAGRGHLDVLKYAQERGCPWDDAVRLDWGAEEASQGAAAHVAIHGGRSAKDVRFQVLAALSAWRRLLEAGGAAPEHLVLEVPEGTGGQVALALLENDLGMAVTAQGNRLTLCAPQ